MFAFVKSKFLGLAGAAVVAMGLASSAGAVPLAGTFGGTIGAPTGNTETIVYSGAGTSQLRWGVPTTGGTSTNSNSSRLKINNGSFGVVDFPSPSAGQILLGTLEWVNRSNFKTGGTWSTALNLQVSYTQPSAVGPLFSPLSLRVTNTEDTNSNPGVNEGTGSTPDRISGLSISAGSFGGTPLDLGSNLSITGYFAMLVNAGSAGTNGFSSSYVDGLWKNREGNKSILGIYALVEVTPVPLPAAAWLLLAGIGGLGMAARRRTAA